MENILNTEKYIAEKLVIKPVGMRRLQNYKKYMDFFNENNYTEYPQTAEETAYALAYALWCKRSWLNPNFQECEYAIGCVLHKNKKLGILFFKESYLNKLKQCEWIKTITQSIYDSAINILIKNDITVCNDEKLEIAPFIGIWKRDTNMKDEKYIFYNVNDFIKCKSEIYSNADRLSALFIKNIVYPKYKDCATQEFFENFEDYANHNSNTMKKDIYGKKVKYLSMRLENKMWRICGTNVNVNLNDVIKNV